MAIVRKEAYYSSCNGVNSIRTLIWQDEEIAPIGIVQIAHGICEHIGRYDDFARFLASSGFVVCGNDHLAHGRSVLSQELLGMCDDGDHVNMLRDMNTLNRIMSKRFPELPYFIFGHSMGSLLARIYSASFGDELAGAVYCGTGQIPKSLLLFEDPVERLLGMLEPDSCNAAFSSVVNKITARMLKDSDELAWISRSKENTDNYRADPMCGFPASNALNKELVTLAVKASDPEWAMKLPYGFPVMLISGAKDPVGLNGKGVLAVAELLAEAGIEPEVILYPGDRHEILNEDDRDKVYSDVKRFLLNVITYDKMSPTSKAEGSMS